MRRIIAFNMETIDGFFEGQTGEIDWHNVDAEFNEFAIAQLDSVDVLLFGRVTYQMMANYWPTPAAIQNDPVVAEKMNAKSKIVFSKTLDKAEWNNTRLVKGNVAGEVAKLKEQPGKDLIIFGSANLTGSLANLGLIDEYRVMVNPIILGSGRLLFSGIQERTELKLLKTRTFGNGNVLLCYQPKESHMDKKLIARASINVNAPIEQVWNALVDPEAIQQYMFGTRVFSDWREGSPILWKGEWQGKSYEDKGVILQLEPGRTIRYSHFSPLAGLPDRQENYHTVTVELSAKRNRTRVDLSQDNNATEEERDHSEKNWEMMLGGLKKFVERG